MRLPVVMPLQFGDDRRYSLFLAALGYEQRARFASERLSQRALMKRASGFSERQVLSFQDNEEWFRASGFEVHIHHSDSDFVEWVESCIRELDDVERPVVCVDVSSFTSSRIAIIVDCLRRADFRWMEVDFVYSSAQPVGELVSRAPNIHVGPVIPAFSGWWIEPEHGVAAVVGLGLEENKAIGAIEHIQASDVWVFVPSAAWGDLDAAVVRANEFVFDAIPSSRRLVYVIDRPFDAFLAAESLVASCRRSLNVVIFPFGPKIFTLCCLLIACLYEDVAVWRVSSGQSDEAIDKIPIGGVCGVRVIWGSAATSRQL